MIAIQTYYHNVMDETPRNELHRKHALKPKQKEH